jgi:hypothetical protein
MTRLMDGDPQSHATATAHISNPRLPLAQQALRASATTALRPPQMTPVT